MFLWFFEVSQYDGSSIYNSCNTISSARFQITVCKTMVLSCFRGKEMYCIAYLYRIIYYATHIFTCNTDSQLISHYAMHYLYAYNQSRYIQSLCIRVHHVIPLPVILLVTQSLGVHCYLVPPVGVASSTRLILVP